MFPLLMLALATLQAPQPAQSAVPQPAQAPAPAPAQVPVQVPTVPRLGYLEASDLVARCTAGPRQSPDYCFGYLASVYDTVRAYEAWLNMREFCIPATTAQAQLRDVVLGYIRQHPDQTNAQAASVVVLALREHFACTTNSPAPPAPVPPRP